jgi:antirestriction protein
MMPVWALIVVTCLIENGAPIKCVANTGDKVFTSEQECKEYAIKNFNPVPDCFQPLTVFYTKGKTP